MRRPKQLLRILCEQLIKKRRQPLLPRRAIACNPPDILSQKRVGYQPAPNHPSVDRREAALQSLEIISGFDIAVIHNRAGELRQALFEAVDINCTIIHLLTRARMNDDLAQRITVKCLSDTEKLIRIL